MVQCSLTKVDIELLHKKISANVKRYRKQKAFTILQISQAMGYQSPGSYSVLEGNYKGKHFNIEHLAKLADIFEVSISDFFKDL